MVFWTFRREGVARIIGAALLPIVPLAFIAMPAQEVLQTLRRLVF